MKPATKIIVLFLAAAMLASCYKPSPVKEEITATDLPTIQPAATMTPFQPEPTPTESPRGYQDLIFFIDPSAPPALRAQLPENIKRTDQAELADLSLAPLPGVDQGAGHSQRRDVAYFADPCAGQPRRCGPRHATHQGTGQRQRGRPGRGGQGTRQAGQQGGRGAVERCDGQGYAEGTGHILRCLPAPGRQPLSEGR